MLPKISINGLHCGHDGSTNLSIKEIPLGKFSSLEIVCNIHKQKGNYVCNLEELGIIIEEYLERNSLTEEQKNKLLNKICTQISTEEIQVVYDVERNGMYIR